MPADTTELSRADEAVKEPGRGFAQGDRVVCVSPVDPILSRGAIYTVGSISMGLYEMMEAPGFLFGDWRFKPVKDAAIEVTP